jgi:hypothetical protein
VTDLAERYRGPSRASRVVALVVIVALVASGIGVLGWSVFSYGTPEVTSKLTRYEVLDEHTAVADFTVTRTSAFTEARCTLTAVAADHGVVGEVVVPVVDGPEEQALRVEVRTERRATTVDLLGCTTPDQARPR